MRTGSPQTGPSQLERLIGGDSFNGTYVPPLAAEVLKEMQAEKAQAGRTLQPAIQADAYAGPRSEPAPIALTPETKARLEEIASAPSLDVAFKRMLKMPELIAAVKAEGLPDIAFYGVPDRDGAARKAAFSLIVEGATGAARYFGSELTLYACVLGEKMAVGARLDKLYGYSDMRSNRFGIQYDRSEKRVRTGLFGHLPFSVGPKELARFVPEFTPASLAEKIEAFLARPR